MKTHPIIRELRASRFMMGVAVIAVLLFVASFGSATFFSTDPVSSDLSRRLEAPSWLGGDGGILGTDQLGRQLWIRLLYGLRTSFTISICAVVIGAVIGTAVGIVAGYFGRWVDSLIMRIADIQMSIPAMLLVMTIIAVMSGGRTYVLILVLGLNSWMLYARVARANVLTLKHRDFVVATVGLGARPRRVMWRHLLPNSLSALVAVATLELARIMLAEASLSFLGFGVQSPTISLGAILAEGRDYLQTQWWVSTFAGLVLALAVLTTNLLGSWLQRVSDPLTATSTRMRLETATL